jgi:hypothetical protein
MQRAGNRLVVHTGPVGSHTASCYPPGTFVAPPEKAEELHSPEVFGRTSSDWVVVE